MITYINLYSFTSVFMYLMLVYFMASEVFSYPDEIVWIEKELIKALLSGYDKRARPVADNHSPTPKNNGVQQIEVKFGLGLIQILELNENEQILSTNLRNMFEWRDYHLMWNASEWGGIQYVNIPTSEIWIPDITLYNYADERLEERRKCDARVRYDGIVKWQPMSIIKSTCQVVIKYFPNDKQECLMKYGPWTFDAGRVNLSFHNQPGNEANPIMLNNAFDQRDYKESPEWQLVNHTARISVSNYASIPESYVDITYKLVIRRQPAFYNYVLVLPCFLLSSLTLVLFWLPPETPAKMVLGMNIFVAFFLLLMLLVEAIPNASKDFPLIGNYYCMNMVLVTLSTFLCLIVVNFHFRGDTRSRVPAWIRVLLLKYFARILCVNISGPKLKKHETGSKVINSLKKAASIITRSDSQVIRASAMHYQKKLNPKNQTTISEAAASTAAMTTVTNNSMFETIPPCLQTLNEVASLARNPITVAALYRCGFSENQIRRLQQLSALNQCTLQQQQHDQEQQTDNDSVDFCQLCASMSAVTNQSEQSDETTGQRTNSRVSDGDLTSHDAGDELAAIWAAAAASIPTSYIPRNVGISDDDASVCCINNHLNYNHHHDNKSNNSITNKVFVESFRNRINDMNSTKGNFLTVEGFLIECIQKPQMDPLSMNGHLGMSFTTNNNAMSTWIPNGFNNSKVQRRVNILIKDVTEIVKGVRFLQKMNDNNAKINKIIGEWRAVGMVLDRIFFISYLIALSVCIMLFFPRAEAE